MLSWITAETTKRLRAVAVGLSVLGLSAYGSMAYGASAPVSHAPVVAPIAVPAVIGHAGPWYTDQSGRVVVIHGIGMVNKLPPYTPQALGFGNKDLAFLAANGFNGIRLGMSWAGIEPSPGHYNDVYIAQIVSLAADAERYGLTPIIDMHQDGYSQVYGGNGAPAWASLSSGIGGTPLPAPANVLPGASIANQNFWMNAKASDHIGLQDHFAASWAHVGAAFKRDSRAIFEMYNEPSPGLDTPVCALPVGCPEFDIALLAPFYAKVLHSIRQVAPQRMVLVEPTALFDLGARTWLPSSHDSQVGFAFHDYCALSLAPGLSVQSVCSALVNATVSNVEQQYRSTGEPLLMDEFGAGDSNEVVAGLLDQADSKMFGWTHWAYWAQDFGKPATYGLVNNVRQQPAGSNVKQALLTVLTRPSPRLIAGTPLMWRWNGATSTFQAQYTTVRVSDGRRFSTGATSEFFLHPRFYPRGYRVTVTGARVTSARNAAWLTLAQLPGASKVTLTVTR